MELIACDWEGCIAEPASGPVPWPLDKIAILRGIIKEIDVPFVLCTGRQLPYVEAALQALGVFSDIPSVAENGASLYFPKTKEVLLHPAITLEAKETLNVIRQKALEIVKHVGGNQEYGKAFTISLTPPSQYSIKEFYQHVRERLNKFSDLVEISYSQSAVDITPRGVNKGSGLRFLVQIAKIDLNNVVGIGDSQGDLTMLREVGHSACPANADENIKSIVEYVSSLRTTDGVIDIIRQFVMRKLA